MSITSEPLRLAPHRIEIDPKGEWTIVTTAGEPIPVPAPFRKYLELVAQGATLLGLAQWSRTHLRGSKRFKNLAWFLSFLYDHGLLKDERALELAEALRPDYTWRESLAFEPLLSLELFRVCASKPSSFAQRSVVTFFVGALAVVTVSQLPSRVLEISQSWTDVESAWPALLAFFFVYTAGRSARGLVQFSLIYLMTRFPAPLRMRFEPISISLSTDDASKASGSRLYVLSSTIALVILLSPLAIFPFQKLGEHASVFVAFFTFLLMLTDLSPFRQSALTEILRAYYVLSDRITDRSRSMRNRSESKIRNLHIGCCVAWVAAFGAFIAIYAKDIVLFVKHAMGFTTSSALVSAASLGLVVLAIFASLVDDIIGGIGDGGGSDRLSIRRVWRRRAKLRAPESWQTERGVFKKENLEQMPFLRQMDEKAREVLLSNSKFVEAGRGEVVCHQGETDRTLYIVLSGRLAVGKRTPSGQRRIITFLEAGAVFGEVAFFIGDRRQADVIATENSQLLAINHDDRIANLDQSRSSELQLRVWFLQALVSSPLFRDLPSEALDALIFSGEKRVFQVGEKIISEGEAGDACYFIVQGRASVSQNFKVINQLKGGDAFGEIALLQPELFRTATVKADSELITVCVSSEKFWNLLASHLPLALQIEELASLRLTADNLRENE